MQACAGATFDRCAEYVAVALETYPSGEQILICDSTTGQGSVVFFDHAKSPEAACRLDALNPGRLVRMITVP